MYDLPDHPDIAETMRTGYPSYLAHEHYCDCDACGKPISLDYESVYYDGDYKHLCKECLLELHEIETWED